MKDHSQTASDALEISYSNRGFLPHVGLHTREGIYYQKSSYSQLLFFCVFITAAITVLFIPLDTRVSTGKLKYVISGGLAWAAFCGGIPYFLRNRWGQIITINPLQKLLHIRNSQLECNIAWNQIIELQICHQSHPNSPRLEGFQLNLAWRDKEGAIQRHCLLKHSIRGFVVKLAKRYETLFNFPLSDYTNKSQSRSR